jgi:hypothetical protein
MLYFEMKKPPSGGFFMGDVLNAAASQGHLYGDDDSNNHHEEKYDASHNEGHGVIRAEVSLAVLFFLHAEPGTEYATQHGEKSDFAMCLLRGLVFVLFFLLRVLRLVVIRHEFHLSTVCSHFACWREEWL